MISLFALGLIALLRSLGFNQAGVPLMPSGRRFPAVDYSNFLLEGVLRWLNLGVLGELLDYGELEVFGVST
jgi:hypothetical protein